MYVCCRHHPNKLSHTHVIITFADVLLKCLCVVLETFLLPPHSAVRWVYVAPHILAISIHESSYFIVAAGVVHGDGTANETLSKTRQFHVFFNYNFACDFSI